MIKEFKVDEGTRDLIGDGVSTGHRFVIVVTGDKPHDQIAKLYFILMENNEDEKLISRKVAWCYEDRIVHPSCKINQKKQLQSLLNHRVFDLEKGPPFAILARYTPFKCFRYKDVVERNPAIDRVGMCVLQDFEALTPDLVARSIETVDVGGLVILLIPSSLNARERFPTSGGVNADFLLSLASCRPYIVMDDKNLNMLPISSQPLPQPQPQPQPQLEEDVALHNDYTILLIHPYLFPSAHP